MAVFAPGRAMEHECNEKTIIGWAEYVDLMDWGIAAMRAKIDTGARTSALHIEELETLLDETVSFLVVRGTAARPNRVRVRAPVLKWARVRSSSGHYQQRPFVRTRVRVGPVEKEIEISLVSRADMRFPMLLGRTALEGDFVVDVNRSYEFAPPQRHRRKVKKKHED